MKSEQKSICTTPIKRYSSSLPIIGPCRAGKSQLITRLQKKQFRSQYQSTNFYNKPPIHSYHIHNNIHFQFYLTQYEISEILSKDVDKVKGFIIMFDVTDKIGFFKIRFLMIEMWKRFKMKDKIVMVIGNKTDLEDKRVVSMERGKMLATEFGVEYLEISNKIGENIELLVERLIERFDVQ